MRLGPCLFAALVLIAPHTSAFAGRDMWMWSEANQILDVASDRTYAFEFMKINGVDTLYLWTDGDGRLVSEPHKYRRLISRAHARGMQVYALDGDPHFVVPGPAHDRAIERFQNILDYNDSSAPSERFDGANLDVEPWALPDWQTNQATRIQQYLDLSADYMQLKQSAGSDILVGPAMPFWFDEFPGITWNGQTKVLHEHVLDIFDYGTILDYRDFALGVDGIVYHATTELDYAQTIGKPVVLGVETQMLSGPEKVTFYEEGAVYMEEQLALVEAAFASNPSFDGFAIHHYGSYPELDGVQLPVSEILATSENNPPPFPVPEPTGTMFLAALGLMLIRVRLWWVPLAERDQRSTSTAGRS